MRTPLAALLFVSLVAAAPGERATPGSRSDTPSAVAVRNATGRGLTVEACPGEAGCTVLGFLPADSTATYGLPGAGRGARPGARVVLYGKIYHRYGAYVVAALPLDPSAEGVAHVTLALGAP